MSGHKVVQGSAAKHMPRVYGRIAAGEGKKGEFFGADGER